MASTGVFASDRVRLWGAGSIAALLLAAGAAMAQPISMDPNDWVVDRRDPAAFVLLPTFQGRSNVLRLGISPPAAPSSFYNWQGYQQQTSVAAGNSFLRGDIWIPADWAEGSDTDYIRTGMWGSAMPKDLVAAGSYVDAAAVFPIISFTNVDGVGRLEVWDTTDGTGWVEVPGTAGLIDFDAWNTFDLRLLPEENRVDYLLNGEVIYTWNAPESSNGSTPEQFFAIYLNARNNGVTEFDTYWSRLLSGLVTAPGGEIGDTEGDVLVEGGEGGGPTVVAEGAEIGGSILADGGETGTTVSFAGGASIGQDVIGQNTSFAFSTDEDDTTVIGGNLELENGSSTTGGSVGNPVQVEGDVIVDDESSFGGNFTVDGFVTNHGTTGPGNSIGVHSYADFLWGPDHTYAVEVNAEGDADIVIVTSGRPYDLSGMGGVLVSPYPADGLVRLQYDYVIFLAPDITDVFGSVAMVDGLPYLTPSLALGTHEGDDAVLLTLEADVAGLLGDVSGANHRAVAETLGAIQADSEAAVAVFLQSGPQAAAAALDQLSGGIHASAGSLLVEESALMRDIMLERGAGGDALYAATPLLSYAPVLSAPQLDPGGPAVWARAFGAWGTAEGDGNAGTRTHATQGLAAGIDGAFDAVWRFGALAGYSATGFEVGAENASGRADSFHLGLYGGADLDSLALRFGAAYARHAVDIERTVAVPGFSDSLTGGFDADTVQVFGEIAYRLDLDGTTVIEPFAGLALVSHSGGAYAESGGDAALAGSAGDLRTGFATIGLRASAELPVGDGLSARLDGMIGWRHAFGDVEATAGHALAGGDAFSVTGTPIAENVVLARAGLALDLSDTAEVSLGYSGQLAADRHVHAVEAGFSLRF